MKKASLQKIAGIAFLLLGAASLLIYLFAIRPLDAHATWFLPQFYDPQQVPQVTYHDLLDYAQQLTESRGRTETRFWYLLVGSSSLIGLILLAWSHDHRRLSKT